MPSLVTVVGVCLVLVSGSLSYSSCVWKRKKSSRVILSDMIDEEEIDCVDSELDRSNSLRWMSNNSGRQIAKCHGDNKDACFTYRSHLVRSLKIDEIHLTLKSAIYLCKDDFSRVICTVVVQKTKQKDETPTPTRRSPTGPTITYNISSAALDATSYVNATTPSLAGDPTVGVQKTQQPDETPTSTLRSPTGPTISYDISSAASEKAKVTAAIVCAIVLVGLCVGTGLLIVLKKPLCYRQCDEDDWDRVSEIWKDECGFLNGKNVIPISSITIGKLLGEGQFGTVAEGTLTTQTNAGEVYTIKIAVKMFRDELQADDFQKEAKLLASLGLHANLTRIYGHCVENGHVSKIAMEYAEMGDLHRYLRLMRSERNTFTLDEKKAIDYGHQIAKGMQFVASKGCVHRDLAARNVLVFEKERLKICDFGLAKDLQSGAYYRKRTKGGVIPFKWCAPEVLLYKTYSEYSDVWSYGIVLWEIVTYGGTPYPGVPIEKLFELLTGDCAYRMSKPRLCSDKIYEIMIHCWNSIPDRRPLFSSLTTNILDSTHSKGLAYKQRPNDAWKVYACE